MPAAAPATVGFFSWARAMASANVTRTTGAGACAPAPAALTLSATTTTEAFDHDIEDRNESEIQERRRDHAAGDGGAHRVARLASGTARDDQRHDAENERERRHQDR